jgi:methionyl-tRNA formyltransferase
VSDKGSVVLIGSRSTVSVMGFQALREIGILIPLIITGDEDPGVDDWRLSLGKAARDAGYSDGKNLLVLHDPHKPEVMERIKACHADLLLSLQWRRILRPPLLAVPRHGAVNLHNAPLPLLRGCDPFSWAIHDGLERMGVTFHQVVDEGVDSGPVLAQRLWPLTAASTAWQIYLESLREAELLMRQSLAAIVAGQLSPLPQEPRYASYHPMGQFRFKPLEVNWGLPAVTLSSELRARIFPPFQLPFFQWNGRRVEVLECHAVRIRAVAGEVLAINPLQIGAKPGAIELKTVRLDGKEMSGGEFASLGGLRIGHSMV